MSSVFQKILDRLLGEKHEQRKTRVGLALGGGAVLGAAHIGVLKALEENDIKLEAITGTSIGAFIAILYAFGIPAAEIEEQVKEMGWLDVTNFKLSRFGLLSNEKLARTLHDMIGDVDFSEANIPLAVVATNIGSGKVRILKEGDVALAAMASTCVPAVFAPVEIDDEMLVDGGLVENVPLSPLDDLGANFKIAVDLNARRQYEKPGDIIDVLMNALDIAIDNSTRLQTREVDLLIKPKVFHFSRTDTENVGHIVDEGYQATQAELKKHPIKKARSRSLPGKKSTHNS
ncbi:MAG: patatin-like phospholipase family protein [Pseudomonadales bacterium]|nr:patatin-like phospholipase family protein [Pseudomonadales bacterium]